MTSEVRLPQKNPTAVADLGYRAPTQLHGATGQPPAATPVQTRAERVAARPRSGAPTTTQAACRVPPSEMRARNILRTEGRQALAETAKGRGNPMTEAALGRGLQARVINQGVVDKARAQGSVAAVREGRGTPQDEANITAGLAKKHIKQTDVDAARRVATDRADAAREVAESRTSMDAVAAGRGTSADDARIDAAVKKGTITQDQATAARRQGSQRTLDQVRNGIGTASPETEAALRAAVANKSLTQREVDGAYGHATLRNISTAGYETATDTRRIDAALASGAISPTEVAGARAEMHEVRMDQLRESWREMDRRS